MYEFLNFYKDNFLWIISIITFVLFVLIGYIVNKKTNKIQYVSTNKNTKNTVKNNTTPLNNNKLVIKDEFVNSEFNSDNKTPIVEIDGDKNYYDAELIPVIADNLEESNN